MRWAWWLLAWLSLGLGLLGVVLPGLPTVPFILLSAYAAARGSRRLHERLLRDPRFGPMIVDWHEHGAVSRRAKWFAVTTMAACAVLLWLTAPRWWMAAIGTGVMAVVGTWLWARPEPPRA
ncbi:membrane protein [Lysobacter arseniciresistens ZS79]|uniref:Inner membrane protein n=1 Tax=Lysobacter arseniciresistens ZS79 TaxID=913325 RepID=A0A0A0F284_9GAMM|nr:YbaN family protein [Lysobacter arseniciresistens]KGM56428.1 membrane protein [Lysobacter arseniciresistens ZS79]